MGYLEACGKAVVDAANDLKFARGTFPLDYQIQVGSFEARCGTHR